MNRNLFIVIMLGILLCLIFKTITFCEEMNIKQLEKQTAVLHKIEAEERVKYFKLLNEVQNKRR